MDKRFDQHLTKKAKKGTQLDFSGRGLRKGGLGKFIFYKEIKTSLLL